MQLVQTLGFGAFIAASFVLGVRLLLLWRRTGEVPELAMGTSFLVGGALGYSAWFAYTLVALGALEGDLHVLASAGLGLTCLGAATQAAGIRAAFRPGDRRATALVSVFVVLMAAGWIEVTRHPAGEAGWWFWLAMLTAGASYLWSSAECLRLHVVLRKRVRFGLAAPHLADRARLWAVAFGAVVMMVVVSFAARLVLGHGVMPPPWVSTLQSLCGLVCAGAIWLGFFPPASYRRRFAAGGASEAA